MKEKNNDLEKVYRGGIRNAVLGVVIFFLVTLIFWFLSNKYDNPFFIILGSLSGLGFMASLFELIENIKDLNRLKKRQIK